MAAIGLQAVLESTFLGFNMNFHLEDKGECLVVVGGSISVTVS